MVTSCVELHQRRLRGTLCQQLSQIIIDNSEMLRFGMVGSFPRSAWQYAPVLQTFLSLFLLLCLIPVLSLSHFCDFIHIFTSSLAFFHLTFHLASYGLQYFDFFFLLVSISKILSFSHSFPIWLPCRQIPCLFRPSCLRATALGDTIPDHFWMYLGREQLNTCILLDNSDKPLFHLCQLSFQMFTNWKNVNEFSWRYLVILN